MSYTLRPHQKDALKAVLGAFKKEDRCNLVMACGTGKTIAALAITEKLAPKSAIVFMPSLSLINQFMKEWVALTNYENYKMLAVCSDDEVTDGIEREGILLEKINFPTTNDTSRINKFLSLRKPEIRLIFCTYQSAQLLCGMKIELAIFDEAHRTAGYNKGLYAYALFDKNIQIAKRLFMTATPRCAAIAGRKSKEEKHVFSMDDEALYGKRAYTLTFRQAIKAGLICDSKVIVSILKQNSEYESSKDYEMQEKAIALSKAIKKTGAKKVISFHASVNDAMSFAKMFLKYAAKDTYVNHISAKQNMADRLATMTAFKNGDKSVLTNAKCLTEGVDVPAIDMVAFMSPKSSTIDIVQAIGRTLRTAPGKKVGYVFLPLLLDVNTVNTVNTGKYNYIWQVLQALKEQDSELSDLVRNLAAANGSHFDYKKLNDFIEFYGHTNPELEHLIKVAFVDKLNDVWQQMYDRAVSHKEKYGHLNISKNEDAELWTWANRQAGYHKRGVMSASRVKALQKIDFPFLNSYDAAWHKNLVFYIQYKQGLRKSSTHEFKALGWGRRQRQDYREGRLSKSKIAALKESGFELTYLPDKIIDDKINECIAYKKQYANWNIPSQTTLGAWVRKMRRLNRDGTINNTVKKKLEEIGFDFEIRDRNQDVWDENYALYLKLAGTPELGKHLGWWQTMQREAEQAGTLSKDKIKKLLLAGFVFRDNNIRTSTLKVIERLAAYYKANKTYLIPAQVWNKDTHSLYVHSMKFRKAKREGMLDPHVEKKLNSIGFSWEGVGSGANFKNPKTHPMKIKANSK